MSRVLRTAAGVAALTAVNLVAGRLITGPWDGLPVEHRLNHDLRRVGGARTAGLAAALSRSSDTSRAITAGACLSGLLLAGGRRREAAVPGAAMALAAATHLTTSLAIGRPRPALERFGTRQPTSSFPSGHVGAMTALGVTIAHAAAPLPAPLRVAVRTALAGYLVGLGWSRLYNAQHYASDVLVGYANGAVSALLARDLLTEPGR